MSRTARLTGALPARWWLRRLLGAALLLWAIASLMFLLTELSPGTPADRYVSHDLSAEAQASLRRLHGVDRPWPERYARMMGRLLTGDLGQSTSAHVPVRTLLAAHLPDTLLLSGMALLFTWPLGLLLGAWQALRRGETVDTGSNLITLALYSMPAFWLGLMLKIGGAGLGLPTYGRVSPTHAWMSAGDQVADLALHLVLPTLTLGLGSAAVVARFMRGATLDALSRPHVRTARAMGLPEGQVVRRHVTPHALLPILTLFGLSLPSLVGGTVVVEAVFGWPGMGTLILDAVQKEDVPVLVGCFLLYALVVTLGNLLADVGYAVADPRIRYDTHDA